MASPAQPTGFACVISAATGKLIGGRIISVHKGGDVTVSLGGLAVRGHKQSLEDIAALEAQSGEPKPEVSNEN